MPTSNERKMLSSNEALKELKENKGAFSTYQLFGCVVRQSNYHWGETGLANAGVSLSKMDAPKVGKSDLCVFEVFYHNLRASHSPTVFI